MEHALGTFSFEFVPPLPPRFGSIAISAHADALFGLFQQGVDLRESLLPEVGLSSVKAWGHHRKGLLDSC